jgi:hypothetical protein
LPGKVVCGKLCKIVVLGDENATFQQGERGDLVVRRLPGQDIENMNCVVSLGYQPAENSGRKLCIDDKLHASARTIL